MKGQEEGFMLVVGLLLGLVIGLIISSLLLTSTISERDTLADGICKLKFGEEYRHTDVEWKDGNTEVICETYQAPDIDSIVIRRNE